MYIFIFMVHLFFCSCSFVWSLGFRNIYSVEKMYIFTFCFSIFFLLLFSFLGLLCIFWSVCYSLLDCSDQMSCLCTEGKGFWNFSLVSSVCLVVSVLFLVLLLFLCVFVLTLLVDVFSFLLFLFVYGLCFVGPSTSV